MYMEKIIYTILFCFLSSLVSAQDYQPSKESNLVVREIDDFKIKLPIDCSYNKKFSKPDEGNFVWTTPGNTFMFIYCYFQFGEDFSQEERLIGEADQLGIEVTGNGDIANMKIDESRYLSFTFTDKIGIGVTRFYPEENIGICFFVITPEKIKDDTTIFEIMASIRSKISQP